MGEIGAARAKFLRASSPRLAKKKGTQGLAWVSFCSFAYVREFKQQLYVQLAFCLVRRRPGKTLRCFPSFFPGCRPVRARARSKLFCKKVSSKNFTLATARPPPRTCAILSMSTSDSELPLARIVPCGHAPRIDSGGTPHQFSFLLLMIFDSSSMKLLISLNCRYTEANRT